jgi:hypothetical protein
MFEFSQQIFEEYSDTECHKNPSYGNKIFCGQRGSRFTQFFKRAKKMQISEFCLINM